MSVTVTIPTPLRGFTGGADAVELVGGTVGEVIDGLLAAHLHARRVDGRSGGARALSRPAVAWPAALVRRGRRGGAAARAGARSRARGADRPAGPPGARLPVDQRLARHAGDRGVPAADRRQRRCARRRRDHRARAHQRLRQPGRTRSTPCVVRRARRDRRRRRGLREPAPHPAARAGVHQARSHADRRHRGRPLEAGAGRRPDLVRREDRRDDRGGGHRASRRGRGAVRSRSALRPGLLLRTAGSAAAAAARGRDSRRPGCRG